MDAIGKLFVPSPDLTSSIGGAWGEGGGSPLLGMDATGKVFVHLHGC